MVARRGAGRGALSGRRTPRERSYGKLSQSFECIIESHADSVWRRRRMARGARRSAPTEVTIRSRRRRWPFDALCRRAHTHTHTYAASVSRYVSPKRSIESQPPTFDSIRLDSIRDTNMKTFQFARLLSSNSFRLSDHLSELAQGGRRRQKPQQFVARLNKCLPRRRQESTRRRRRFLARVQRRRQPTGATRVTNREQLAATTPIYNNAPPAAANN